jgi:hypothetical protein
MSGMTGKTVCFLSVKCLKPIIQIIKIMEEKFLNSCIAYAEGNLGKLPDYVVNSLMEKFNLNEGEDINILFNSERFTRIDGYFILNDYDYDAEL